MVDRRIIAFIVVALLLSLVLGVFVSPFASSEPDGLEKVAEDQGFLHVAEETEPAWDSAPIPDYGVQGVENEGLATGLAGLIGTLITFAVGLVLVSGVWFLRARSLESRRPG